jgi:Flp pilus assembly pilin Flp
MFRYLIINLRLNSSQSEKGQDLAEYSMLIGLIALLVVVSLTVIGASINTIFTLIATAIRNGL